VLKKLDPFEASPVLRGAGVNTAVLAIKSDKKTFADEADTALAAVKSLIDRTKSLADLRREQGRDISDANVKRLQTLVTELQSEIKEAQTILDAAEPADRGKAALLMLQRTINETRRL
jgi:ferritin